MARKRSTCLWTHVVRRRTSRTMTGGDLSLFLTPFFPFRCPLLAVPVSQLSLHRLSVVCSVSGYLEQVDFINERVPSKYWLLSWKLGYEVCACVHRRSEPLLLGALYLCATSAGTNETSMARLWSRSCCSSRGAHRFRLIFAYQCNRERSLAGSSRVIWCFVPRW